MKLNLVDRRTAADGTSREFHGDQWSQLERLVGTLGGLEWAADVVLVDDEGMADLNARFREKAGVTDVLSFSYLEFSGVGAAVLAGGERYAASDIWLPLESENTDPGRWGSFGELVLAPAFIGQRCAANDWPLAEEIPMLVVHGCLHLLGWDHEEEAEGQLMQDHEVEILAAEGLTHPLRQRS